MSEKRLNDWLAARFTGTNNNDQKQALVAQHQATV
jgi:hypothetical protein